MGSIIKETVKEVIHQVLCGENLRNSTEIITRKRISIANGATIVMFLEGCKHIDNLVKKLPSLASERLKDGKINKNDKWILNWMLGLTDKAVQNILRDDSSKLFNYANEFSDSLREVAVGFEKEFGELTCSISLPKSDSQNLDWESLIYLLCVSGAQTLTIRGSEKSTYGKLFERLILGSLLHILGFKFVNPEENKDFEKVFWLSQRAEKRESDATLIYKAGKGVRFDIGFIGRGNTEISLDKVSRFEREMDYGRKTHFMATFIIVDRIGSGSRIYKMAEKIDGTIIQMSMSYWPKLVALNLQNIFGYKHEILTIPDSEMSNYIRDKLKQVPITDIIR